MSLPRRAAREVRGVRVVAPSGQDPPDRVRPPRRGRTRPARARQAGDLRLPGVHLHLQRQSPRLLPAEAEDPAGPPAGEARGDQGGPATATAPAHPRTGEKAGAGNPRLLRLPRRADQLRGTRRLQGPGRLALAAFAPAAQSDRRYRVDPGSEASRRLPPETEDPSSLAQRAGRRHAPEVGAGCPNWARPDLCGGHEATRVPTAIVQILCGWPTAGLIGVGGQPRPLWRRAVPVLTDSHGRNAAANRATDAELFVSLELSCATWLVTSLAPGSDKMSKHAVAGGDGAGLLQLLARLRAKAEQHGRGAVRVICIQEAGFEGFWVHRLLAAEGIESHVVDPASVAVPRRHRRAKTDAIDGETLLRTLLAWRRGEPRVCAMVVPPSPEEEDERRISRERETLIQERVRHTNRIKGLL